MAYTDDDNYFMTLHIYSCKTYFCGRGGGGALEHYIFYVNTMLIQAYLYFQRLICTICECLI